MDQRKLGAIIRDRRNQMKVSQRKIGAATGLASSYISKIESGSCDYPASAKTIKLIAKALKLDEYTLLLHAGHIPSSIKPTVCNFLLITGTPEKAREILENAIAIHQAEH